MRHSIYSVLAGGATVPNLSIYSFYSLQYWWAGAALLAKLWVCGLECAGFGKCAAWVGLTFGLNDLPFALFYCVPVGFLLMEGPICLTGRSFNFLDALICLVGVSWQSPFIFLLFAFVREGLYI